MNSGFIIPRAQMPLPSISSHQCLVLSCSFSTCSRCSFYQLNPFPFVGSSTWVQMVPQRDASRKAPPKRKGLVNSCRATLADPQGVKTSWDSPSTTLKWCCPPNAKIQVTAIQRAELGSSFAFFLACATQPLGSCLHYQGLNPCPQQWQCQVLITWPLRKSPVLLSYCLLNWFIS